MIRFALIVIALVMMAMLAITVIVSILFLAALALAVGIPLYLVLNRHREPKRLRRSPIEALQDMYAEGKIDLSEFERRVARLVAIEHW